MSATHHGYTAHQAIVALLTTMLLPAAVCITRKHPVRIKRGWPPLGTIKSSQATTLQQRPTRHRQCQYRMCALDPGHMHSKIQGGGIDPNHMMQTQSFKTLHIPMLSTVDSCRHADVSRVHTCLSRWIAQHHQTMLL